jgi:mono/diheme cytochrome c family protein
MQRKFLSISSVTLVLGLILSACGGGNGATEPASSAATIAQPTVTPSEPVYSEEAINEGKGLFAANCSACHGAAANGVEGLGKGLRSNEFVQGKTDDGLMEFIKAGRPADDPLKR